MGTLAAHMSEIADRASDEIVRLRTSNAKLREALTISLGMLGSAAMALDDEGYSDTVRYIRDRVLALQKMMEDWE